MLGTPQSIADEMEEWLETEGSRRLHRACSRICPAGWRISATRVVPELQRRGLFRTEYEGATLRENLGLPRPKNRFFQN